MRIRIFFMVVFFSMVSLCSAGTAAWYPVGSGSDSIEEPLVLTTTTGVERISFEIEVPGFIVESEFTKGGTFDRLALPGHSFSGKPGEAKLPAIRLLVEIPHGAKITINPGRSVIEEYQLSEFGIDGVLVPVQDSILKTEDGFDKWQFRKDEKFYSHDEFLPVEPVTVGQEMMMRAHRVVQLEIVPVSYNPVRGLVRICTRLGFDIQLQGGKVAQTVEAIRDTWSETFEQSYAAQFINYGMMNSRVVKSDMKTSHWDGMLIISHPGFYAAADVLAQWRRKMGYYVEHVDTTTTGTTRDEIKAYIQNAYNTWTAPSLSFVLLVGDVAQIPTVPGSYCSNCASDSDYACLAGADNVHDVYIGRISVETVAQAEDVFGRFMIYAKAAFNNDMSWIKKACFAASCDSTYNTYRTHEYCLTTYTQPRSYSGDYYPGSDPGGDLIRCIEDYGSNSTTSGADVIHAIEDLDKGRAMAVYSGHCGQTSWSGPSVTATQADGFTCADRDIMPFMVGHCCLAHSIDYSTRCMGEAAIRSVAIGYLGSSNNSMWGEDDYLQRAWFKNIFTNGQHRMGEYTINAMIDMYNNYSSSDLDYYMDMVIFGGDPTMEIFTEIPLPLSVTHASATPLGQAAFSVNVMRAGSPLANARVCLTKNDGGDTVHEFGMTDASGDVTISMNPAPASVGTLHVTVTYYNSVPYEGTVTVIVPSGPWLVHDSHGIDDSAGNNDGIVNPGETIIMPVTLANIGADPAVSVSALLSSASVNVTVTDNAATYPDIPVSMTGQSNANHYAFSVGAGAVNGESLPFTITWSAAGGYSEDTSFTVPVCEPLIISGVTVSNITTNSAIITWNTTVNAGSTVFYGVSTPPGLQQGSTSPTTSHSVTLNGLDDCTTYHFSVSSTSANCYTTTDDNSSQYYSFTTMMAVTMFEDDMESGAANWTAASPWVISNEAAHSPTNAWSDSPGGVYGNGLNTSLTSVPFDLSSTTQADLRFWHTYDFESGYDYGHLEITTNGSTWTSLATYNGTQTAWTEVVHDLSSYVGNANVQVRFRVTSDGSLTLDGWHIDDISIGFAMPCVPLAEYHSHVSLDSCPNGGVGDSDGTLDAGETIVFQIDISNTGSGDVTDVWAELSSLTPGVTVSDGQADYPDILQGTTETSLSPHFTVNLSPSIACGSTIEFNLAIHSAEGDFSGSFSRIVGVVLSGNGTALDENFSGGIPGTWTIVDGGSGGDAAATWTTANPGGRTATTPITTPFAIVDSDEAGASANQDEQLISPVMDLGSATSATLAFDQYFYYYSSGGDEYGDVDVRSSLTGGVWQNVYRNHGASSANPDHRVIDITAQAAGAADVQIRFYYYGGAYDWYWMVDNVQVTFEAPGGCTMNACDTGGSVGEVPDGMSGSDPVIALISGNDIVLSFDPAIGASHYNVYRGSLDSLHATGSYCHDAKITEEPCGGSPDTTIVDYGAVTDGNNYYYLINGNNTVCEGTFGTDSTGIPREDTYWPAATVCYDPCP